MQALDQMLGSSGMDISSLAARFGLNPDQAQSALGSLMPAVLGGFQKKAEANDLALARLRRGSKAQGLTLLAAAGVLALLRQERSTVRKVVK